MIKFWVDRLKSDHPHNYRSYMGQQRWDSQGNCDMTVAGMSAHEGQIRGNDEDGIRRLILGMNNTFMKVLSDASGGAIADASKSPSFTVWVLKGIHQSNDPHITVGYGGLIYHLNISDVAFGYCSCIRTITLAPGTTISEADRNMSWRK